jgi:ubiquinone/menaquinone biosynthesis C-methylase UbiE
MAVGVFLLCSLTAAVMVWESRIGKMRSRERLLANVEWTGTEQVLDIGCGRGLLLIGAAKHLTSGKAVGIDIWQTEDLSGNRPEATLANAHIEGVEGRIKLETADMRCLPFPDGTFDVVLSRTAIHNVYASGDRAKVIGEVTRVMKPGGRAIIEDIRYGRDYARLFAQLGCTDIQHLGSRLRALFATLLTFGSVRPVTLLIKKAS